jgi:hypothetical protein
VTEPLSDVEQAAMDAIRDDSGAIPMPLVITEPGLYLGLSEDVYHSDPVFERSLSQSGAKTLLRCPQLFRYQQQHPSPSTKAQDLGTVAHELVLGTGVGYVEVPYPTWQTNAAKDAKAKAEAAGQVALLTKDLQIAQDMADALLSHPVAGSLLQKQGGQSEASVFWVDKVTGVWRRARFDRLDEPQDGMVDFVDYKTAKSADPAEIVKAVWNYGYHQQQAWYEDACRFVHPGVDVQTTFIFQEKEAPYIPTVCQLAYDLVERGRERNAAALELYAECVARDYWPPYVEGIATIGAPGWAR